MNFHKLSLELRFPRRHFFILGIIAACSISSSLQAAWYDNNWSYRKQVTINSSMTPNSDQTDFPVLIYKASDTDLQNDAQADGDDILFTSSDETTKLDHEIEAFDSGTGEIEVWVRIPTLANASDTIIYMYYGNSGAANQENPTGVWDSNFVGVWHMSEDPSITTDGDCGGGSKEVCDSTSNNNDADTGGSMTSGDQVAGQVNGSLDLDGDDSVEPPHAVSLQLATMTLEAWIEMDVTGTWDPIIRKGDNGLLNYRFEIDVNNKLGLNFDTEGTYQSLLSSSTIGTTWTYIAATYNESDGDMRLYIDSGTSDNNKTTPSGSRTPRQTDTSQNVGIGRDIPQGLYFDGQMDEVRVSNIKRSSDWLQTTYNNTGSPATYLTFGSEENAPAGGPLKGAIMLID